VTFDRDEMITGRELDGRLVRAAGQWFTGVAACAKVAPGRATARLQRCSVPGSPWRGPGRSERLMLVIRAGHRRGCRRIPAAHRSGLFQRWRLAGQHWNRRRRPGTGRGAWAGPGCAVRAVRPGFGCCLRRFRGRWHRVPHLTQHDAISGASRNSARGQGPGAFARPGVSRPSAHSACRKPGGADAATSRVSGPRGAPRLRCFTVSGQGIQ
jgi:hypothetical protein